MEKISQSFIKSIFMGEIQEDLVFPYPKFDSDELDLVKIIDENIRRWGAENLDAAAADTAGDYPEGTLEALGEMGILGLNIPDQYGGLELSMAAFAKVYEAIASIDGSLPVTFGAHASIGLKGLLLYGTDEQKQKYLPDLASGKKIAAFALTEPGAGSDAAAIQTRAVLQEDGTWVLNGQKSWITNGRYAQFFTVFAKTLVGDEGKEKITAFIVDGDCEGFTRGPEEHKMGIKASSTVPLYFDNVILQPDAVMGEVGKGFKIAMRVLNSGRLGLAAGVVGGFKELFKIVLEHTKQRKQFGRPLADFELIKDKIARITVDLYVMESMLYLSADLAKKPGVDFSLEAAICKVFASERGWLAANEMLQIMGGLGYMKEYPFERVIRDTRINMIFEGTNEILRLFIALSGLQQPGEYLRELGQALRGPIKGFGFLADYAFTRVKEVVVTPRLTKVHPSLKKYSAYVTKYTEKLHLSVNSAIMKFGKRVVGRELMLRRYADTAIDLYGMIALISRVSAKIEEVGEENARDELDIARIFCDDAWRRIKRNLRQVRRHSDQPIRRLSAAIVERGRYDFNLD